MIFKEAIATVSGLKFIVDKMQILSAVGYDCLMKLPFITDAASISRKLDNLEVAVKTVSSENPAGVLEGISRILMNVRDVSQTVERLSGGAVLDEVEFFELKNLSFNALELKELITVLPLSEIEELQIPDCSDAVRLLDPENTGSRAFHIYDAYDADLSAARKALRALQNPESFDEERSEELTATCRLLEAEVCVRLSARLKSHASILKEALLAIGRLDLILAQARLASEWDAGKPSVSHKTTNYHDLKYPPVEAIMQQMNRAFQPVSLRLEPGVTLITGANMGGKTITLKSLALAQTLVQFGFYCPATKACVSPVHAVLTCIGDTQSEESGLSSFGAEMLRLDEILKKVSEGDPCLVVIDEPARTTNPAEGKAIVEALIEVLERSASVSIITTHYSGLQTRCRQLRVKGLKENTEFPVGLRPEELQRYMDYTLTENDTASSPREALRIAALLGVDSGLRDAASRYLTENN